MTIGSRPKLADLKCGRKLRSPDGTIKIVQFDNRGEAFVSGRHDKYDTYLKVDRRGFVIGFTEIA